MFELKKCVSMQLEHNFVILIYISVSAHPRIKNRDEGWVDTQSL
jgi:hypothetical protein